jgi:hypothetical protein
MKTFHIIEAKYFGWTNHKPPRIRLWSARFEQTIFILQDEYSTGAEWLNKNGFNLVGAGYTKDKIIFVSDTFKPLKP